MKITSRAGIFFAMLLPVVCLSARALAQTDPTLLINPWEHGQAFDTSTDAVLESSAPNRETHDETGLSSYHAFGRWRVLPDQEATPRFGYDLTYFDITTTDPALPRHLWNGTVGFAQPVADFNKWFAVVTGAAGYAGDTPFSDPHAVYFTGNVIVGRKFSDDKAFIFALNYDGNRSFLPDVPIPGFAYADRYNEHVTYVIGLPLNSIRYEPQKGLQFDLGWGLLGTFKARVGWEFQRHYSVYTSYTDRLTAFHLSDLPEDRRLFLQEHRAEVGFRWNPTPTLKFSVGTGWAFGQEFSEGYDLRGTTPLRHLRDGPFGRAMLEIGI
jgi:hypothetical protein